MDEGDDAALVKIVAFIFLECSSPLDVAFEEEDAFVEMVMEMTVDVAPMDMVWLLPSSLSLDFSSPHQRSGRESPFSNSG